MLLNVFYIIASQYYTQFHNVNLCVLVISDSWHRATSSLSFNQSMSTLFWLMVSRHRLYSAHSLPLSTLFRATSSVQRRRSTVSLTSHTSSSLDNRPSCVTDVGDRTCASQKSAPSLKHISTLMILEPLTLKRQQTIASQTTFADFWFIRELLPWKTSSCLMTRQSLLFLKLAMSSIHRCDARGLQISWAYCSLNWRT